MTIVTRFNNRNLFVLLLMTGLLTGCMPPYPSVSAEVVTEKGDPVAVVQDSAVTMDLPATLASATIAVDGHKLYYVESGNRNMPLILFVHGTPGTWEGYAAYLQNAELQAGAHLIAVDRPGFGQSVDGDWFPSFKQQAADIMQVSKLNHSGKPIIVVGHSLGGSIAYRMAADFEPDISGLLVISSSIDPELGKPRWYNRVASTLLVNWMLPEQLAKANLEIMPLRREFLEIQPLLSKLTLNVTVIQGTEDKLVDPGNLAYAERTLIQANFKAVSVPDMGHFVLWQKPELVVGELLALLKEDNQSD